MDGRPVVQGLEDVPVIRGVVFALDGEDRDLEVLDQDRRDVVLGAEGVRGAEADVGPAELEGLHEIGRLRGDVEAGRDADPGQGLLPGEGFLDPAEDGHGAGRPLHPQTALRGQSRVLDIVVHRVLLSPGPGVFPAQNITFH